MSLQKIIAVVRKLLQRLRHRSPLTNPGAGASNNTPPNPPPPDGLLTDPDKIAGDGRDDSTKTEPEPLTPKGLEKTLSDSSEDTLGNSGASSTQPSEDDPDASGDNSDVNNTSLQGSPDPPSEPTQGDESQSGSDTDTSRDFNEAKRAQSGKNPRKIGPRRTPGPSRKGPVTQRPPAARPELICRWSPSSWQWEVVLSVDDECGVTAVYRDGEPLKVMNRECRLTSLTGRLTIVFEDGQNETVTLFDGKPLIFKLRNDWTDEGRKTKSVTKGYFIVFAPGEWERTGRAPVEPAGCTDNEFKAHYFYRNGAAPTESIDGFRQCEVPTNRSGFEFIGTCVFDDSEFGDLFVGAIPTLKLLKLPSKIAWVRVGEERANGWKGNNFRPGDECLSDVLNGRQGRFFIRVYDSEVKLFDSGEFRFLRDLKEIRVNGERYTENTLLVPPVTGYPPGGFHAGGWSGIVRGDCQWDGRRGRVRGEDVDGRSAWKG